MLLLYTIPKPFRGHIRTIQYNALRSWTMLGRDVKIIIFGNEEGSAEAAKELGIEHIAEISKNEFGTPLVNDVFAKARERADGRLLCYVNADIILTDDFLAAQRRAKSKKRSFLMIGQRWDIEQNDALDFTPGWQSRLRERVTRDGVLHAETGIDYFVYTSDLFSSIHGFAVGRIAWDNWMIFDARSKGTAVIDATRSVMAIHQNHDYANVPRGEYNAMKEPEAARNLALAGGYAHCFTILDATWIMTSGSFLPAWGRKYVRRRPTAWIILHDRLYRFLKSMRRIVKRSPSVSSSS